MQFKIEDNSFKNDIKEEYLVSRCKSQSKSRQINLLATDEEYGQKLYLNLLKTQIFKNSHSSGKCKTDSYKSLKDFQISKNISLKNITSNEKECKKQVIEDDEIYCSYFTIFKNIDDDIKNNESIKRIFTPLGMNQTEGTINIFYEDFRDPTYINENKKFIIISYSI